jgi:RNA polymerase sigma factor (sigma-70 family)
MINEEQLQQLIDGCVRNDAHSQKMLYKALYSYAMSICLRYSNNRYEASDIMNDGFYKVFNNIQKYDHTKPFKAWLGRIMQNTAIDHYRANLKVAYLVDLEKADDVCVNSVVEQKLAYDDLLALIQKLSPAYRTVFNLFAIDGYSHEEIAEMLHINQGTSKSNLFKARKKLQAMLHDIQTSNSSHHEEVHEYGLPLLVTSG